METSHICLIHHFSELNHALMDIHQKCKNLKMFPLSYHCSFDVRGRAFSKALYWSDTNAFGPRAYFLTVSKPATLSVDNVQLDDEGVSSPICKFSFIFCVW